ncbi:hypothetical protein FJY63_13850, partial [Candidatus Sumerlaeota bacterium]|nr:hypothetical protein [Candidatus Sumerlaeota bacterium]
RDDLADLVETFFRRNNVRHVGLPTNGLLPERAQAVAEQILARCPGVRLEVNVSLDDLGSRHDAIRGVEGGFERTVETIRLVGALRSRFDNLVVNVETVVSSANWRNVGELLDFVRTSLDVNGHYVEVMRGNSRDARLSLPPLKALRRVHRLVMKNHIRYHADPRKKRWRPELLYLHKLRRWQEQVVGGGQWQARCAAARSMAVMESDGRVRACEIRGIVGDLRKSAYDLRRVLESPEAEAERREIEATRCSCTHCVFVYETLNTHSLPRGCERRWLGRWFALRVKLARLMA